MKMQEKKYTLVDKIPNNKKFKIIYFQIAKIGAKRIEPFCIPNFNNGEW